MKSGRHLLSIYIKLQESQLSQFITFVFVSTHMSVFVSNRLMFDSTHRWVFVYTHRWVCVSTHRWVFQDENEGKKEEEKMEDDEK